MPSCDDCGLMFENIPDLATHMNRRCPENNDLKRKREDDEDDYNRSKKACLDEQTMPPNKVTKGNETNLWWKMYWPKKVSTESKSKTIRKPFRFKVGDKVRLTYKRNIFTREYDEKWTGEIFKVAQRIMRGGVPIYRLKDFHDEVIKGTLYQSKLQKV